MPKLNSRLTGTAGEHYVAYKLSTLGYVAAIPREGTPTVDILACNLDASQILSIQVKTTSKATRTRGRGEDKVPFQLQLPLGRKAAGINSKSLVFAFVDLNDLDRDDLEPDVYIVPSRFIYNWCKEWRDEAKMVRFHIEIEKMQKFKNNWDIIRKVLG